MRYKHKRKAKARSSSAKLTSLIAETRLCKELNFKITNRIVELADKHNSLIVFEDLKNIRKNITNDNTVLSVMKKSFRLSQNRFLCNNLHLQNADYNTSVNITKRAF